MSGSAGTAGPSPPLRPRPRPARGGRALGLLFSFTMQAGRWLAVAFLVLAAMQSATALVSVYGAKLVVDAAVAGSAAGVAWGAVVWAGGHGASELCMRSLVAISAALNERVSLALDSRLMTLLGGLPGIEHHERPAYLDRMAMLRAQRGVLVSLNPVLANLVGQWLALLGSAAVLAHLDPWLLLLPLFGLGSWWTGRRAHAVALRTEQANAEPGRLRRHLFTTATSAAAGKELRLFGLDEVLVARLVA
ncbi:MAG TPA: hypothetical protein VHS99_18375 [Chloroflexota bacterium]|nr:hypothetical protein [Chloroflexota bacterium]